MADERGTKVLIIVILIIIIIAIIIILILSIRYSPTSSTSLSSTGCPSVSPPTSVVALAVGLNQIRVTWNKANNATRYKVYVGTISNFTKFNSLTSYLTGDTEYTITGMIMGRTYFIAVSSINTCNVESLLSTDTAVTLGFPSKFRIVSRDQPSLALKISPDFVNVEADTLCSGNPGDDFCIFSYDQSTSHITTSSDSTTCLSTAPESIDLRVKYAACSLIDYYNYSQARMWNYNPSNGTLCNPNNPEGLNCIKLPPPQTAGTYAIRVPYDGTTSMQWDIVQA